MSAPQRLQRQRTTSWRMPEGAVYVGRPSPWGNPFAIEGPDADDHWWIYDRRRAGQPGFDGAPDYGPYSREDAVAEAIYAYESMLRCDGALRAQAVHALRGRDLVCWCDMFQPCHADHLLEIVNFRPGG